MSFLDDLRNLDRNNVGGWSKSVKAALASPVTPAPSNTASAKAG